MVTLQQATGKRKSVEVVVVDDYQPWQLFVAKTLRNAPELEIIGMVSDGVEAVQKAKRYSRT